MRKRTFDVFISHASEDKASLVEPLAIELRKLGLSVWFDKFELKVGDSLRESIERGLATSRYGIVVYSPAFFKKKWPRKEVNGLFAREISGNKQRILPILHNLPISELRKRYPIQGDKYTLSSSLPLDELCRELVRVIKPELLELDSLKQRSLDATEVFLNSATAKYPEYDFSVYMDGKTSGRRIEMQSKAPLTSANAPTVNIRFLGEGARKAEELLKTGKAQNWTSSEFTNLTSNLPFFPKNEEGMLLSAGPQVDPNPRQVRVEIDGDPQARFELMTMSTVRRGTEEGELKIGDEGQPLSISLVSQFTGNGDIDISLSWKISGFEASKCLRMMRFVEAALSGGSIKITDLRGAKPMINLPLRDGRGKSPSFDPGDRKLVALCAQIEDRFNCTIIMQKNLSETEVENLEILDSLLNGTEVESEATGAISITKGLYADIDAHICRLAAANLRMFLPVGNYAGFFDLMGTRIEAPEWGFSATCDVDLSETERETFCKSEPGYTIRAKVKSTGTGRFLWKS